MGSLGGITAVILAGGLGTRLRPVVNDRPKVLAEVCGRPFLSYLLDQLQTAGAGQAVLCTGYLGEQIEAALGDCYCGLRLSYSQESAPLGTAGAVRAALARLGSDPVLVLNGDSFFEADLADLSGYHQRHGAQATLALARLADTRRFGRVVLAADGQVSAFEEKGARRGPGWINAGVYVLARQLLETIPAGGAVSLERECFPAWIGRGLYGYPGRGRFLDIGTPESYAEAREFFAGL
jgi:NDP-sugar pyrophosphorylase family protein